MGRTLPAEMLVLGWSVVLLLAHIVTQAALAVPERGLAWNAGPRDGLTAPADVFAGRARRALENFKETYPAFVALALALVITGRSAGLGQVGAWLWLVGRVIYLPLYVFGVPWVRTLAFGVSVVGLILMLSTLLGA